MGRNMCVAAAGVLALVAALTIASLVLAQQRGRDAGEPSPNEFAAKIVDIQTTTRVTFLLEDVKVIRLADQWFLSGTGIKKYRDLWWEGLPVRVNLSSVVSYCPMTAQQFEKAAGKRE